MLSVRLLGAFEISRDGDPVALSSRAAQSLFAYLILNAGTTQRREKLAGLLWPDSNEESARDYLRHALWRVRKALPASPGTDYLLADDLAVAFNATAEYWLDAQAVERVSESAGADELIPILSVYQGELLPGFYDEWVLLEREHLQSVFEHKMARLMSLLQEEQRWLDILDWGERWIRLGQKPEPAYRALMTAHAAKGDMSKVAATYGRCAKSLGELGIEPSEHTRALYEKLIAGKAMLEAGPVSPVKKSRRAASNTNLPVPLTSFVGRQRELNEIARLLSTSRLLTLTGSGGVGKTRLAIEAARQSINIFEDGVYWVELEGLTDPTLIPQEIARALNLREVPNEPLIETLKAYLGPNEALIVLDSCEHVIRACAQYAEELLAACPGLRILATTTQALGLFNETIWQISPLSFPGVQPTLSLSQLKEFASIELFCERARHAKPGFALSEVNAKPATQICQRLDGIPLAIELAAVRVEMMSVDEIASRLDSRFSLLTTGSRTAIARHQTLRATIDWSYDLLSEPERMLLRRLAIFVGGFTLQAAESVCAVGELKREDILDVLGRLVDKSLVIVEPASPTVETRYHLLETIRQYALEKLAGKGEERVVRDQHLEHFMWLAEDVEPRIYSGEAGIWFSRLDKELDNFRAAMEWSIASDKAVAALRIAGSLVYFWFIHGPLLSEWNDRIRQALARPEGMERTLARAKALNGFGFMYWADMYPTEKRPELEEALAIGRELGDPWSIATALRNLGMLSSIQGINAEARSFLEQSLEIWRQMGEEGKLGSSRTLQFLGDVAFDQGELEQARALHEESAAIWREHGEMNFLAYSVRRLSQLAWRNGDFTRATALCKQSLILNIELGDLRGTMACLAGFAAIALAQGESERACRLMAAVEAQLTSNRIRLLRLDKMEYERNLALLRAELDEKALARLWTKGKEMSLEQAIALASEEVRA